MNKYNVIVKNAGLYKKLTGIDKKEGSSVEHVSEELSILNNSKAVTVPELTLKILEKKQKKKFLTADEQGAETPEGILATRLTINTNFAKLCRKAVKEIGIYYDENKYWWIWDEANFYWKESDEITILNKIDGKLVESSNTIEAGIKSLLLEALKRQGRMNTPKELDWHWIQFKDKLINFETGETMVPTQKHFVTNPIPWNIGKSTETPVLDALLKDWLNDKKRGQTDVDHNVLKDFFAFALPPKYFISTVPFLYGAGGDGKSQFENLMEKFIGTNNHTSTTLGYLEKSQFGTYSLRKKLVAFISEVPKNEIDQFTTIKTISGGTKCFIERKGHDRSKEHVYSKIFLVGNDVPISSDTSDGFARRIHPIEFPNRYKQGADIFESVPDIEYENLAAWCLKRLKELTKTYILTGDSADIDEKKANYKKLSNLVIKFMEDKKYIKTPNPEDIIVVSDLLLEFNSWALDNNKHIMSYNEFRAKINNLGMVMQTMHVNISGERTRRLCIQGIKKVVPDAENNTVQSNIKGGVTNG